MTTAATPTRRTTDAAPVAAAHAPSTDEEWRSDLLPPDSDIIVATIVPELLTPPAALDVEPLRTSPLVVDAIPISTIDMPPVAPAQ